MYICGSIVLALIFIALCVAWLMAHAPYGVEIPGVGFIQTDADGRPLNTTAERPARAVEAHS